jgi:hypothetical protein
MAKMTDLMTGIMAYESGDLNDIETLELFSKLIISGDVWRLQGHYGRMAHALISDGWVNKDGTLTDKAELNGLT